MKENKKVLHIKTASGLRGSDGVELCLILWAHTTHRLLHIVTVVSESIQWRNRAEHLPNSNSEKYKKIFNQRKLNLFALRSRSPIHSRLFICIKCFVQIMEGIIYIQVDNHMPICFYFIFLLHLSMIILNDIKYAFLSGISSVDGRYRGHGRRDQKRFEGGI